MIPNAPEATRPCAGCQTRFACARATALTGDAVRASVTPMSDELEFALSFVLLLVGAWPAIRGALRGPRVDPGLSLRRPDRSRECFEVVLSTRRAPAAGLVQLGCGLLLVLGGRFALARGASELLLYAPLAGAVLAALGARDLWRARGSRDERLVFDGRRRIVDLVRAGRVVRSLSFSELRQVEVVTRVSEVDTQGGTYSAESHDVTLVTGEGELSLGANLGDDALLHVVNGVCDVTGLLSHTTRVETS